MYDIKGIKHQRQWYGWQSIITLIFLLYFSRGNVFTIGV